MYKVFGSYLFFVSLVISLVACDSSENQPATDAKFSVDKTSVEIQAFAHEAHAPSVSIEGRLDGTFENIYTQIDLTNAPFITDIETQFYSDRGVLTLTPLPPNKAELGKNNGFITIKVCADFECRYQYQNSPVKIDISYAIDLPDLSLSATSIQLQGFEESAEFAKPKSVDLSSMHSLAGNLEIIKPENIDWLGLYHRTPLGKSLKISVAPVKHLPVGDYSTTLLISAFNGLIQKELEVNYSVLPSQFSPASGEIHFDLSEFSDDSRRSLDFIFENNLSSNDYSVEANAWWLQVKREYFSHELDQRVVSLELSEEIFQHAHGKYETTIKIRDNNQPANSIFIPVVLSYSSPRVSAIAPNFGYENSQNDVFIYGQGFANPETSIHFMNAGIGGNQDHEIVNDVRLEILNDSTVKVNGVNNPFDSFFGGLPEVSVRYNRTETSLNRTYKILKKESLPSGGFDLPFPADQVIYDERNGRLFSVLVDPLGVESDIIYRSTFTGGFKPEWHHEPLSPFYRSEHIFNFESDVVDFMSITPDGKHLIIVSGEPQQLLVIKTEDFEIESQYYFHQRLQGFEANSIAFYNNNYAVLSGSNQILRLNILGEMSIDEAFTSTNIPNSAVYTAASGYLNRVFIFSNQEHASELDRSTGQFMASNIRINDGFENLQLSGDGSRYILDGRLFQDIDGKTVDLGELADNAKISLDGNRAVYIRNENELISIDIPKQNGANEFPLFGSPVPLDAPSELKAISGDGTQAFVQTGRSMKVITMTN